MTSPTAAAAPPTLSIDAAVARITLARPDRHNAIEAADVEVLRDHLARVDADAGIRALLLTARGPTFCAGASLRELERGTLTPDMFESLADRLAAVRVPTICALNGSVYGGGTELALCCDLRYASDSAVFAFPEMDRQSFPGAGGPFVLTRLVGYARAADLLLRPRRRNAQEMREIGLVNVVSTEGGLMALADGSVRLFPYRVNLQGFLQPADNSVNELPN